MTVDELILELKKYPGNSKVEIYGTYDINYSAGGEIQEVFFDEKNNSVEIWNYNG